MNPIIETLQRRCSLRNYQDKPISSEHKAVILRSAMRAPTAGNMMLYSIITVEKQETKDILAQTCDHQPFIAKAPWVLIFVADMQRWYDYYYLCNVPEYCEKRGLEFRGPNLGDLFIAVSDALIAAQNAVIAAESLGIGSCYIGDIMEQYETHRQLFKLPDLAFPIAMLCLGYYPAGHHSKPRPRFDPQYIVFPEEYRQLCREELEAMFADREKSVQPNNVYGAENFGQLMYARKTGASFSMEMHRSITETLRRWLGYLPPEIGS